MTNAMGAIPMEENQWRKSNGGKPVEQRLMEEIPMEEKEETAESHTSPPVDESRNEIHWLK